MIEELKKAIEEAEKGGYKISKESLHWGQLITDKGYYTIIFNHDFAQAVFGDGEHYASAFKSLSDTARENGEELDLNLLPLPLWKSMLQQMVVQEEPLIWLSKAIDNKAKFQQTKEGVVKGTKDTSAVIDYLKNQYKNIK